MRFALRRLLRSTATLLFFALLFNDLAHAARLPRKLAYLQQVSAAQQAAAAPAAPYSSVPAQILTAHTAFLSNLGAQTGFPYSTDAAYNQVFADLQAWGRFQLVDRPAQADLILQLRFAAPIGGVSVVDGQGGSYRIPRLMLNILDPQTQTVLWTVQIPVYTASRSKDHTDWLAVASMNLTSQLKVLTNQSLTPAESGALNTAPKYPSHKLLGFILIGSLVAIFLVTFFLAKHKSDEFATQHDLTCATNPFFCTN